jgi:leucyl/phenylalanyl-tRNA--protein transferase
MARSPALRWITENEPLPPPARALREPNGLLCAGVDLSDRRLLEAYRQGIFPWYSVGQPVLWWSPDPRMVLYLDDFKESRSLVKTVRRVSQPGGWTISLDRCFCDVMRACAEPRPDQDGTWITDEIVAAYSALAARGMAHSVEIWEDAHTGTGEPARLIGGFYGVAIGRMFYGESMFARRTDASKVALLSWVHCLRALGFRVIDCQQRTRHLASLGAAEIDRRRFLDEVAELTALPSPDWSAVKLEFPKV